MSIQTQPSMAKIELTCFQCFQGTVGPPAMAATVGALSLLPGVPKALGGFQFTIVFYFMFRAV